MSRNQKVGQWGEQAAADYLSTKGYEIIARNVRTPYGEIDLIAQKDGFTIFVEVKARTSSLAWSAGDRCHAAQTTTYVILRRTLRPAKRN